MTSYAELIAAGSTPTEARHALLTLALLEAGVDIRTSEKWRQSKNEVDREWGLKVAKTTIQEFPSQKELRERSALARGLDTFSSLVKQGYTADEARGLIAKYSTLRFEGEVMGVINGVPTKMSRQAYEILKREGILPR